MTDPTTQDAYRSFIDDLVSNAKEMGGGQRLAKQGNLILESKDDEKAFKKIFSQLSPSQRDLLVRILQQERLSAFHDLLAALTWQIDCHGFALTFRGTPMQPIEGGLHNDFIGRVSGEWEWPQE